MSHTPRIASFVFLALLLIPAGLSLADGQAEAPETSVEELEMVEVEVQDDPVLQLFSAAESMVALLDERWILHTSRAQFELRAGAPAQAIQTALRTTRLALSILPPFDAPMSFKPSPILTEKPVPGSLSSPFGVRKDPIRRRQSKHHAGLDFAAKRNTLVQAAGPGVVTFAGRKGGYGRVVIIDHGLGLETRYAHLQEIQVKKGEFVPRGSDIGKVGSSGRATGPHLHFEVRQDGVPIPPADAFDVALPGCSPRARDCRREQPNT